MKQIYRSMRVALALLAMNFCTLGGVSAQNEQAASSTSLSSKTTASQVVEAGKPITYQCSNSNSYENPARIYKNNSFTVASTDGSTITKIVLTGPSSNPVSNLTAGQGEYTDGTWTGSATSVVFTASIAQARISTITVYYVSSSSPGLSTPQFAFEQETYPAIQLQDGEATLQVKAASTNSKGAVTYSVSPEGATIDGEGNFTATKAGTYTVTARLAQDDEGGFAAAEINTQIEVKPEAGSQPDVYYRRITSQNEIVAGATYLIVCESGNMAMGAQYQSKNTLRRYETAVTIDNGVIVPEAVNESGAPYEITLTSVADGVYGMMLADGQYLGNNADANYLGTYTSTVAGAQWTIEYVAGTGAVTMTTKYGTPRVMSYNGQSSDMTARFSTYKSSNLNASHKAITLYVKVEQQSAETVLRDGLHEGMAGTLCVDRTIGANETKGAAFYTVAGVCYRGEEPAALVLEEAETLEAGRGYVFIAGGEKITTTNADEATAATGANDGVIYGSLEGCYVPEGCYVINQNTVKKSNGRSHIQAGRAYIDVAAAQRLTAEEAAAQRYRVLGFDGSLTGIGAIVAAGTEAPAYDLAGRRARMDRKGIYVKDGKKVIVK